MCLSEDLNIDNILASENSDQSVRSQFYAVIAFCDNAITADTIP